MKLSVLSAQYVKVPVASVLDGQPYDPTGDSVFMAFPPVNQDPVTWYPAVWEQAVTGGIITNLADCLVGTGGVVLAIGTYLPWVKVVDNPETPILPAADTLVIF